MAHGKAAARDARYGRRGGGWADPDAGNGAAYLDAMRDRQGGHLKTDEARQLAAEAAEVDRRRGDAYVPGWAILWADYARLAAARRDAGVELTARDLEALERHPQPVDGRPAPP